MKNSQPFRDFKKARFQTKQSELHGVCCGHEGGDEVHSHGEEHKLLTWTRYLPTAGSFILLVTGIGCEYWQDSFFDSRTRLVWYLAAYFLAAYPVLVQAFRALAKGDVFNEFFLMGLATVGAFYLREFEEGVAVMLFYVIGEHLQESAVLRSRKTIKALMDNRPQKVTVIKEGYVYDVEPIGVQLGDEVQLKAGERVALDGELLSVESSFDTSALSGESKPATKRKGEEILAGMVNLNKVVNIRVTALYEDSAFARILKMVEQATSRKAKPQQFISKFAKIYTPIVVVLALTVTFLPYFLMPVYIFEEWLYRALVFLVISCPCALVISIPLGYFGGIGAASRQGILFKGSSYLDEITKVDTVVMDKTGTLTKGVFEVDEISSHQMEPSTFLALVAALESHSSHPIAKAVVANAKGLFEHLIVTEVEEIASHGMKGNVGGKTVLAGNVKLLARHGIAYDQALEKNPYSMVVVAVNHEYVGYITITDKIKEDAKLAISQLRQIGIRNVVMLSGDKSSVVANVANTLGISEHKGDLLPEEKVAYVEALKSQGRKVAFVGDGINDAPVIALADVGIAMGALGSDAAVETADAVIQNDHPSKLATAIQVGKATQHIVWQNIGFAFAVKAIVLLLGAEGIATMWEAVFADVGVALLAIINAVRIQRMRF